MAFLQYKTEAIPGKPLKRKVTQEETRERKKQYEKDRERKFIDSWKQDRPWLHHNVEQNVMVCNSHQLVHRSQWTKRAIYIFFCNSKFWFLIILFSGSIELIFYSIFFLVIFNVTNSFVKLEWKYTLMDMIMLYAIIYLWT
jgi:hypothetical protein